MKELFLLCGIAICLLSCNNQPANKEKLSNDSSASTNDAKKYSKEIATGDTAILRFIESHLAERKTDLCSFYNYLSNMETTQIRIADSKYPDFGKEHNDYAHKLMKQEQQRIFKEKNIHDSLHKHVIGLGVFYCAK